MRILRFLAAFFLCGLFLAVALAQEKRAEPFPTELETDLSAGTSAIYHLDFQTAEKHFQKAIELKPDHPAAYFFEQMLTWYRLTYDSLLNRNPRLEKLLLEQSEITADKAKAFTDNDETEAVGYLYWGGALGGKGWYHVTRGQWVRAYFSGKKGYSYMKKTMDLDPNIYDAYLGIGMYEYYAATLGPTLKALASFAIRGDREEAIKYLRLAELKSRYVRVEAAYFLWTAAMEEKRFEDAHEKIKLMIHSFPDSPLFCWCEIQTLYAQKKWDEVIEKGEEFIFRSNAAPQPEHYSNPYELLLAKVFYHCGMSALQLGDIKMAKHYFDRTIDQSAEFEGWKVLAYLRRGELFDMEGKRLDALGKYRAVLKFPEFWDSHKIAHRRIKEPYNSASKNNGD